MNPCAGPSVPERAARIISVLAAGLLAQACAQPTSAGGGGSPGSGGSGTSTGSGGSGTSTGGGGSGTSTGSGGSGTSTGSGGASTTGAGGASADGGASDGGGVVCSNTDRTQLSMDATGFIPAACNDVGITGPWYCFADAPPSPPSGNTTSNCVVGRVPYNSTSRAMCISGTTGTDPGAYGAAIGLNLNHLGGATQPMPYNATAHNVIGFEITITGTSGPTASTGVGLRVNFTTGAATSTTQPFVTLPGAGTYRVLFADAVVSPVQGGTGVNQRLDATSIYAIQFAITHQAVATPFNYCITSLKPILGPATPPTSCGTPASYGNPACGTQDILGEVGPFALQNNVNMGASGSQCVQALTGGTCAGFSVSFPSGSFGAGGNTVWSYPSLVYGWQNGAFYGAYRTARPLTMINAVPTTWHFTTPTGGSWDAAYDIWLGPQANPATAAGGLELMVWLNYGNVSPAGSNTGATFSAWGATFEVWTGTVQTWRYIAYRRSPGSSANVDNMDLKTFFDDAMGRGVGLQPSWFLLGVQAGFEFLQSGGGTAATSTFSVSAN